MSRILVISPEITYLPEGMGREAYGLSAKSGGMADVVAGIVNELFNRGVDVHVALPDYRCMYHGDPWQWRGDRIDKIDDNRIHLAQDRTFFYLPKVYSYSQHENMKTSIAFQREVINNIIPRVQPDLIHCNDWMTGLIPAFAKRYNIPSLFTIHNVFTMRETMSCIEEKGIDVASFWENLFFENPPRYYEEARGNNVIDFLATGVFAANFINTVSYTFLQEIVYGKYDLIKEHFRGLVADKFHWGFAEGILNAPPSYFFPYHDDNLAWKYGPDDFVDGKRENKLAMQRELNLIVDPWAPVLFWPSRLDNIQKGAKLLSDILYQVISKYWDSNLQIVFVADGESQQTFRNIVNFHGLHNRVAVCNFDVRLEHLLYGASDFTLMPSFFEPCGLPQMICQRYGSLPIVHNTGGLHDTVEHLDIHANIGNGFIFDIFDSSGLFWAIDRALDFFYTHQDAKHPQIRRIMLESGERFNLSVTAQQYINLYSRILQRPI